MITITCLASLAFVFSTISISNTVSPAAAKNTTATSLQVETSPVPNPPLPPDLMGYATRVLRSAAQADTFVLHWATFDGPTGD